MELDEIPRVSSEGGPLILCDSAALSKWNGAFGRQHFEQACDSLGSNAAVGTVAVDNETMVVWDMKGTGTADILHDGKHLYVIQYWADGFLDRATLSSVLAVSRSERKLTALKVDVHSGVMVILWAAEDGSKLAIGGKQWGALEGELSIGDGGVYLQIMAGEWQVGHREVNVEGIDFVVLELFNPKT